MRQLRRTQRSLKALKPQLPAMLFASLMSVSLGLTLISERSHGQAPSPTTQKPARERAFLKAHSSATASPATTADKTIYPKAPASVRFNHAKHAQVACSSCHTQALTSAKSADVLHPSMSACSGCHSDTKTKPQLNECAACHISYQVNATEATITTAEQWRAIRPAPMLPAKASPRLKFSHAAHMRAGQDAKTTSAACTSCHAIDAQGAATMPQAAQCASCHNGSLASDTCSSCHLQAPSGRLVTSWKTPGALTPTKLLPSDHSVDWIKRHGTVALAQGDDCMSCHAEQTCASCHQARGATPRSAHPPNFLAIHRIAARSQEANCTSCHSQQTFCASCHTRTLNITAEDYAPPTRRKFHPPGWLDKGAGQNHGLMAKRNIDECASCHQEQDCLSCHRGISPHPATYQLSCKRALEANPRPCLACHQDTQRLQSLCR